MKVGWDAQYLQPILRFIEEVLRDSTKQYEDKLACQALTKYVWISFQFFNDRTDSFSL